MPARPVIEADPIQRAKTDPRSPYEAIAAQVRARIMAGELTAGDPAPTVKELAADHHVATGTAHRTFDLLKAWDLIEASRGRRAVMASQSTVELSPDPKSISDTMPPRTDPTEIPRECMELLDFNVVHRRSSVSRFSAEADPADPRQLRRLLVDAVRRHGDLEAHIGEYELIVRVQGERGILTTFVSSTGNAPD
jgi:DNA-binding transcriptional regulator YhcF (GntR family)